MSHKLVIVREEGGIFALPDKSPTITIDEDGRGCYKAENLTNDGRTNNVIASADGTLMIGTLSAFSLGNYREFIFINNDTTPAQRYLNWSPLSTPLPSQHSSSTSLVNTYDYTIQISNTDSNEDNIGVDVESWLADFNNYGEIESRGIINITQKSDYTKRITGLVKNVSKKTGGDGYHEITFNLIDNNKNTDMPFLPKDDLLETGAVLVYFTPQGSTGTNGTDASVTLTNIQTAIDTKTLALGGALTVAGDITAFATSDKRLKTNITLLENPLDKLKKINGYSFDWVEKKKIHSNTGRDVGVLAQEVTEVLKEATVTRDNGYMAVRYDKIIPLLINCIKEQQKQINELK